MKLDSLMAYNAMFYFLDTYWEKTKDSELGGLLGTMSPKLFSSNEPIDPLMHAQWNELFMKGGLTNGYASIEESFNLMKLFVSSQEKNFGLNLTALRNVLDKKWFWSEWIEACKMASET